MTERSWLIIHKALHSMNCVSVTVNGTTHTIQTAWNGCRYIDVKDPSQINGKQRFMIQNPQKETVYGKRARNGQKLTWVIRTGTWGLICNEAIERK
tara:strand:+ start:203 stop:490 length:288 start_codon:yes stop_codon:yes gene_type:complete